MKCTPVLFLYKYRWHNLDHLKWHGVLCNKLLSTVLDYTVHLWSEPDLAPALPARPAAFVSCVTVPPNVRWAWGNALIAQIVRFTSIGSVSLLRLFPLRVIRKTITIVLLRIVISTTKSKTDWCSV